MNIPRQNEEYGGERLQRRKHTPCHTFPISVKRMGLVRKSLDRVWQEYGFAVNPILPLRCGPEMVFFFLTQRRKVEAKEPKGR